MDGVPQVGKSWSEAHGGGGAEWRRAGGMLSLTNALPESTCSSRQAPQDYREKARREIRAAAGEGDRRHSWHRDPAHTWGLPCPATHTPGMEQELCPRCPQTPAACQEGPICLLFSSQLFLEQMTFPSIFFGGDKSSQGVTAPLFLQLHLQGGAAGFGGCRRVGAGMMEKRGRKRRESHFLLQRG